MPYVAVDKDGTEWKFTNFPVRNGSVWTESIVDGELELLKRGTIKKLIRRKLTWQHKPVEVNELVEV